MKSTEADSETFDILRTVPDDNAFYFYSSLDHPMGIKANNLEEFLRRLTELNDLSCIEFHAGRHDFENWIRMLGDATLAQQISAVQKRSHSTPVLRQRLAKTVEDRIARLKKVSGK